MVGWGGLFDRSNPIVKRSCFLHIALGYAVLIPICAALGCKTVSPIRIVSPRVSGRVVDARTRQPIAGVRVQRQVGRDSHRVMDPPKGGELMKQPAIVTTDAEGNFTLLAERDLTVLRSATWFSVRLVFEHSRYERLTGVYVAAQATNTWKGEPLVQTGDVLLVPKGK